MESSSHVTHLQWVENALHRLLRNSIRTHCMIDVGAHHGTSLAPFLRAGWRVVAFEPFEDNRRRLEERFGNNPLLSSRAEAVSNVSGTRALRLALNLDGTLHEYHHSLEAIGDDAWHKKGPAVPVRTATLDELVERGEVPEQVGFLKIDTEGHDLAVLLGAARLSCEVIGVEFWNDGHAFGSSPSPAGAMIGLLRDRGHENFLVVSHHLDNTAVLNTTLEGTRPDSWGNVFFFHRSRRDLYEGLLADPDWLFVLEQARHLDELNNDRRTKETTIRELSAAAAERLTVIQELENVAAERLALIQELAEVVAERLALIETQTLCLKHLEEERRRSWPARAARRLGRLLHRREGENASP